MNCREVQDWLLSAEDVRPEAWTAGPAAGHLAECAECRAYADRLAGLEQAWREIPLPGQCESSKQAFLDRLATRPAEEPVTRRRLLARVAWASAASLLGGAGGWLFLENQQAKASDDLVGSLLDWNLRLTRAESDAERARLYAESGPRLESAVVRSHLPAEHSRLAAEMLENGRWLASHRDPLGEALRFDRLADRLFRMAQAAEANGKYRRMARLLDQYGQALENGLDFNLQREERAAARDVHRQQKLQQKLQRMLDGWDGRMRELARFEETVPDSTRKEIQRAIKVYQKHRKKAERT